MWLILEIPELILNSYCTFHSLRIFLVLTSALEGKLLQLQIAFFVMRVPISCKNPLLPSKPFQSWLSV